MTMRAPMPGSGAEATSSERLAALGAYAQPLRQVKAEAEASGRSLTGGTWSFEKADGSPALPYFHHDELLSSFIDMAYDAGWVSPAVDWMTWIGSAEARHLMSEPAASVGAGEARLEMMMTALVRGERFGEGGLSAALGAGILLAMAERASVLASST